MLCHISDRDHLVSAWVARGVVELIPCVGIFVRYEVSYKKTLASLPKTG